MACLKFWFTEPSIIGALNDGKVGAPCAFEGYCNSELFEAYVEKILVPTLKPGQTIDLLRNKEINVKFSLGGIKTYPMCDFASLQRSKQENF